MSLHIAFTVGSVDYVIPAAQVLHLESFERATAVPGAPAYVAGLVQSRGRVIPVVDLRARFRLPATERTVDHRIVVVQDDTRVVGLLVDSAREVLQLDDSLFTPPPELVDQQTDRYVTAVISMGKRMYLLVDVPRLIGKELSA